MFSNIDYVKLGDGTVDTDDLKEDITKIINKVDHKMESHTPLQNFYKDQTIFMTGGTGFLGKVLIEKVLRTCPDIKRIYILIREKRDKKIEERVKELFQDPIFSSVKGDMLTLEKKVIGIPGDCSLDGLGLSELHRDLLTDEVSIVFHVAATVRFDEKLKTAAAINIQSTSSIIDMCKDMPHLKSFVHVSTAYANCFTKNIEEKFYDYSIKYNEVLNLVDTLSDDTVNVITPHLMTNWPNTYTFTKALAEDLVRAKNMNLPMGIFRPGIVISSAQEPIPGWTDNYNGPTGVVAGVLSGVVRTMFADSEMKANLVPVDLTVNALIASAWDVAEQNDRRGEKMLIYNYISTVEAPISWGTFEKTIKRAILEYPSVIAIWHAMMLLTKNKLLYTLYTFFLHIIPAFCIDLIAKTTGQKPRLQRTYKKVNKMVGVLTHFTTNEWQFQNNNVQEMWERLDNRDKTLFQFTMQNFNWSQYASNYIVGVRTFLLKDNMSTLESGRTKSTRFYYMHQSVVLLLNLLLIWIVYRIYSLLLVRY